MDCVREGKKNVPTPRTAYGATVRSGRPVVTLTLIGICAVSWILQLVTNGSWTDRWLYAPVLGQDEPWRLLTTTFLHSTSPLHILFNMYALWVMGQFLEPLLGRARFLTLYLLTGLAGSVGVLLLAGGPSHQAWYTAAIGASGAVFGLFGAAIPVLRQRGLQATQMVGLIVVNFALGFFIANIAWQAHLAGGIAGFALGAAFAYAPRERRALVGWGASALLLVLLVVLCVLKYASV